MNDFESKIKESLEKEIGKYSPDDIEAVRKAASESGSRMKWSKLYIIAACLTFVILAGSITGILLKGNGNGGIIGNSDEVSGTGYQESSQTSDIGSEQVSEPVSQPEDKVTFAQKHPELAALPEGSSFEYFTSKNDNLIECTDEEAVSNYLDFVDPEGAEYIGTSQPEDLDEYYVSLHLENNKHDYTFIIYENGYISLSCDLYISSHSLLETEWYKRDLWTTTGETFAEKHPDMIECPLDIDKCIFMDYTREQMTCLQGFGKEQMVTMWDYLIDSGKISNIEANESLISDLLLDMHTHYVLKWSNDDTHNYTIKIYENGYVYLSYKVIPKEGLPYNENEYYYNKNGFLLSGFYGNITFFDKHCVEISSMQSIKVGGGKSITGENAIKAYTAITGNFKAIYTDAYVNRCYLSNNYIDIEVNLDNGTIEYLRVYEGNYMTCTYYQDGENITTEVYYGSADMAAVKGYDDEDAKTFADMHPEEMSISDTMLEIYKYTSGGEEITIHKELTDPDSIALYSAIIGSGETEAVDCPQDGSLNDISSVTVIAANSTKTIEIVIYENGYMQLLTGDTAGWAAGVIELYYDYYYNPAGYDLEAIFSEYVDLNQ